MSGALDPEREALAAEYVLGTLDARGAAEVVRAMQFDPALARAVAAWERRLSPLSAIAMPETPPPELWARIERRVAPPGAEPAARRRVSWPARLLGGWAIAATVAAAALFALRPAPVPLMTVMLTDRTQTAWTASFDGGGVRLTSVMPVNGTPPAAVPEGRVQQLWVLPPGAPAPTSLGLLPGDQRTITIQAPAIRPVPGMLIEITLEPPGGSPTGRPTGPVQFIGRLSQPGPDS